MELNDPLERSSPPTLDEYGEPSPLRVSYCKQIVTEEEYEKQTSIHTQKALDELFKSMESNPATYRRVMQRRKQEEMENEGLVSFLKAKALYFLGSHDAFDVSEEECKSKMDSMRTEMTTVFQYSEGQCCLNSVCILGYSAGNILRQTMPQWGSVHQ